MPIPGTTKADRLDENVGAAGIELAPDDLRAIEDALAGLRVHGERYPAHHPCQGGGPRFGSRPPFVPRSPTRA